MFRPKIKKNAASPVSKPSRLELEAPAFAKRDHQAAEKPKREQNACGVNQTMQHYLLPVATRLLHHAHHLDTEYWKDAGHHIQK